jgi:hypothetical protein
MKTQLKRILTDRRKRISRRIMSMITDLDMGMDMGIGRIMLRRRF